MNQHPIALLIEKADKAINQEDFDTVVDLYAEDAVLVIKPGTTAVGKVQIRSAMEAIAAYFDGSLDVRQAGMVILETGDTALVLARTLVSAKNFPVIERKATYVFKKDTRNRWVCAIDNSYGHEVLDADSQRTGSRPMQKYCGSCHCGAVSFEIETDFPELTTCDCSICRRKNALMVKVHEDQFKLLSGADSLTEYRFHTMTARHFFCKTCGIYPFHRKRVTPDYLGINVFCLHNFDPLDIPIRQAVGAAMK